MGPDLKQLSLDIHRLFDSSLGPIAPLFDSDACNNGVFSSVSVGHVARLQLRGAPRHHTQQSPGLKDELSLYSA
jgi:hypothetical protein